MKSQRWIHSALVDLAIIDFGWLPLYVIFILVRQIWHNHFYCDVLTLWACPPGIRNLIILAGFITSVHRHHALPLIYADRNEFARHPKIYFWAPLILFGVVFPICLYRLAPPGIFHNILYGIFTVVAMTSGVWNLYHVLMQKFGFLRIYAAKLGYGDVKLDRLLFFTWLAVVIVGSSLRYTETFFIHLAKTGFAWGIMFQPATKIAGKILLVPTALYAAYITWQWGRVEWRNFTTASLPRIIFAASMALICLTFAQSLLLGFIVLGFSHAFEYCVFATLYANRKYRGVKSGSLLRYWARGWLLGPALANALLAGAVWGFYRLLGAYPWWGLLPAYAITSSLLHFYYDGLLWKMSNVKTREIVLDLR